jgi:hypothetical protein
VERGGSQLDVRPWPAICSLPLFQASRSGSPWPDSRRRQTTTAKQMRTTGRTLTSAKMGDSDGDVFIDNGDRPHACGSYNSNLRPCYALLSTKAFFKGEFAGRRVLFSLFDCRGAAFTCEISAGFSNCPKREGATQQRLVASEKHHLRWTCSILNRRLLPPRTRPNSIFYNA